MGTLQKICMTYWLSHSSGIWKKATAYQTYVTETLVWSTVYSRCPICEFGTREPQIIYLKGKRYSLTHRSISSCLFRGNSGCLSMLIGDHSKAGITITWGVNRKYCLTSLQPSHQIRNTGNCNGSLQESVFSALTDVPMYTSPYMRVHSRLPQNTHHS